MRVIVQVFRAVVQNFDQDSVGPGLSDRSRTGLMGQNGASVALHKMKADALILIGLIRRAIFRTTIEIIPMLEIR